MIGEQQTAIAIGRKKTPAEDDLKPARRRCAYHSGFNFLRIGSVMSAPTPVRPADPVRDLAAKIYIELVCRNVVVTESAAQIKSNPENLARISFKLADTFQRVDVELKAPSMPKNQEYDMKAASLPGWQAEKAG